MKKAEQFNFTYSFFAILWFVVLAIGIIVPLILDKISPYYVWGTRYALTPRFISIPCAALLSGFLIWMIFPKSFIKKKMIISSVTIFFETWIFGFLITFFYDYWDWHSGEGTAGLSLNNPKHLRHFNSGRTKPYEPIFQTSGYECCGNQCAFTLLRRNIFSVFRAYSIPNRISRKRTLESLGFFP